MFSLCDSFSLRENTPGTEFRNNSILRSTEREGKHMDYFYFKTHSNTKNQNYQEKKATALAVLSDMQI